MAENTTRVMSGARLQSDHPLASPGLTTLLFIGYDRNLQSFAKHSLSAENHVFLHAATGAEGLQVASDALPDLVLLDPSLPDMDGYHVIHRLREFSTAPIIVVSSRKQPEDKIKALDAGANDFVEKPFDVGELLARLRVALRPRNGGSVQQAVFRNGPLDVDVHRRQVRVKGVPVSLTPREFNLLIQFIRHPGRVLTHQQLLFKAWGPAHVDQVQYLRVYVRYLRQKLGPAGALIETQPGVGYCMVQAGAASSGRS